MAHKDIPEIAAIMQIAYYVSFMVPGYKKLNEAQRRKKVADDYFTTLKMTDVIFEEAKHKKLPKEQERIIKKYLKDFMS
jgi:predicted secreted acid phosphatase